MATTFAPTPVEVEYRDLLGFAALLGHLGLVECRTCTIMEVTGDRHGPRHNASSRCQSGGRSHCTCDTCF